MMSLCTSNDLLKMIIVAVDNYLFKLQQYITIQVNL